MRSRAYSFILLQAPLLLFAVILLVLSLLAPQFFTVANALNILIQSSAVGVAAVGMTFVLLTAGVDLSVGAAMFVGGAVGAKLLLGGYPLAAVLVSMVGCGLVLGAINSLFITRAKLAPFIATLALLFIGRGFALWLTQTRALNLPENFVRLGGVRVLGAPVPLLVLAFVVVLSHLVLTRTPFGRQLHALGNNPDNARKAGLRVRRLTTAVYLISGVCASVGGILALTQLGALSPKFGENYEFKAIAAAVLGGTSLFGGRGAVWPGTLLGALLIQMLESGLVMLNADPYLYPLVTAGVILLAVLLDSARQVLLARFHRRQIYRASDASINA